MLNPSRKWRLKKDLKKGKFCFLIGVNNWAIELQKHEFELLYKLIIKVNNQISQIKNDLLDDESINLEIEQLPWYAELDGNKNEWDLRLVFESSDQTRSFEMYWPIPIAKSLSYEIQEMWESMDLKINKSGNFIKNFP